MAADCSIAMGKAGSASAIEAAGTVIMNDNLDSIPLAIRISSKTVRIAGQNIAFAIGVKVLCMVLGALGITGMGVAVFADTGVALLCVLNSLRALRIKA
jgi:Cd2+/Zn2+-exporting ATPase